MKLTFAAEDALGFVELRLSINVVNGDGQVDSTPAAIFSFSISSAVQHFPPTPLAAAGAPLGAGPRTLYETGGSAMLANGRF